MVNNGTLEHTDCGKRITRDSLQAAMAPGSEGKWLHGEPAEPEKQPQPGWVINQFRSIGWRTIGPGGCLTVLDEDWEAYPTAYDHECDYTWKDLPDCTGFDYVPPPEQTPAEKLLREVGIEFDGVGDYLKSTGQSGVHDMIWGAMWTAGQLEAIAAHMREREGGAE